MAVDRIRHTKPASQRSFLDELEPIPYEITAEELASMDPRMRRILFGHEEPEPGAGGRAEKQESARMLIKHFSEVALEDANMDGAEGAEIRWILGPKDDMPHFFLRQVEVRPGGNTPHHQHPYEHEFYVLAGSGALLDPEGNAHELRPGAVGYIAADELHQFRNTGQDALKFLCLIPRLDG